MDGQSTLQSATHCSAVSEFPEALRSYFPLEMRVNDLTEHAVLLARQCPLTQAHLLLRELNVNHRARAQNLKQHNPKSVHIRFPGELLPPEIFRIEIPKGTLHRSAHMGIVDV
jgi:hypothetical protein